MVVSLAQFHIHVSYVRICISYGDNVKSLTPQGAGQLLLCYMQIHNAMPYN